MLAQRLTSLAMQHPLVVAGAIGLATALAAVGAARLRSESYLEGHLPADDPKLAAYKELVEQFGGDRVAVFGIGCGAPRPCADVFEPEILGLLRRLEGTASAFATVAEVRSLASSGVLVERDGALGVERLDPLASDGSSSRLRQLVARDPVVRGTLVSDDLRTAIVVVQFRSDVLEAETNREALEMHEAMRALARSADFELHGSGVVLLAASANRYVQRDLAVLTPVMLLILAGLLIWIFRSPLAVAIALAAVVLPAFWSFGLMGWTGRPITPVTSMLPILILVVGVTDVVHFLVRARELGPAQPSVAITIREVAREVGPPTSVTAVTAALGFLSFLAGSLPNMRDFGVFAAVGILAAWALTFSLVPILLTRFPSLLAGTAPPVFTLGDRVVGAVRRVAARGAYATVALALLATSVALVGLSRIRAETDGWKLRGDGDPFVRSERFFREHLGPSDSLEVLYRIPEGQRIDSAASLARLQRIEGSLAEVSGGRVFSVLLPLRLAQREFAGGELALPTTSEQAAQLLLLLEAADGDSLRSVLTVDHRLLRFAAPYPTLTTGTIRRDAKRLESTLQSEMDPDAFSITGSSVLLAHVADLVLSSQIASFSTAFLTIFAVIFACVRSFSLGVLGTVPNVLPVLLILGFMGFAEIDLDVGTAMIASIVLGVSVDDTIYFLLHYRNARARGATIPDATTYTLAVAGKPALFCAVLLSAGFFVLAFSSFQSLAIFGLLSGFAVLLAAISELALLPALLEVSRRWRV